MLTPDRKARWLANLRAAGIDADEETLQRVEPALAGRVGDIQELLDRLGYRSDNPDYLRSRSETEPHHGRP